MRIRLLVQVTGDSSLIRMILRLVAISAFTACSSSNEGLTPTAVSLTTAEPAQRPLPTSTAESQRVRIEPLVTAARVFPHSWSTNGERLAFWTFTPEEVAVDYTYPPGTLHFLNAHTGQVCESPFQVGYGYFGDPIAWLPDGKLLLVADDQVRQGTPCGDDFTTITHLFPAPILSVASVSPDRSVLLLSSQQGYWLYEPAPQSIRSIDASVGGARPGYSWSPNGSRLAVSAALDAPGFEATTSVVDVETGGIEDIIRWHYRDAEGNFAGPTWLSEDQFLIHETTDQGSLLVTVGQGVVQVISELFGLPFEPNSSVSLRATAAVVTGTSTYHILLSGVGEEASFPPIRLYHSEDGKVEELPFPYESGFSPDGQSLLLSDATRGDIRLRAVDPPDSEARLLLTHNGNLLPLTWSPDGTKVAFSSPRGVPVFSSPDGDRVGLWETGDYSTFPGQWSPDGEFLAVQGYLSNGEGEALFVIHIPSPTETIRPLASTETVQPSTSTIAPTISSSPTKSVNMMSDGTQANDTSEGASISADGRYVAFASFASNLVVGDDTDNCIGFSPELRSCIDIFVHDRQEDTTERVSIANNGTPGDNDSGVVYESGSCTSLSADGRYIAFHSYASNLVSDDTNDAMDVFVYDYQRRQVELVSVTSDGMPGNGVSAWPTLSADGRYVALISEASNLVTGDTNGVADIFLHDRQTGTTTRVSIASDGAQANGASGERSAPHLSVNGRFVVFVSSASNLVDKDTNDVADIFVHDRQTGMTERVSVANDGAPVNAPSRAPVVSAEGRYVAFESQASNLVADDTNDATDVFVHDRQMGQTERISLTSDNMQGNGLSGSPSLSADGRWVAFSSLASNLVANDTNEMPDVFVRDRQTGEMERVSVASDGTQGNGLSYAPSLSADGRYVAFVSQASNLVPGDTNERWDVFVHDRLTGQTERVSVPGSR